MVTADWASAQDPEFGETARYRFGPLRFTPSIRLTDVGVDTNVFNDPNNPQQDTTAAIGPSVDLWMKAGPARFSGKTSGQYLYFNQFKDQRGFNTSNNLKLELPFARVSGFVTGTYENTKNRPGYEIDSRARMVTESVGGGIDVRLSGKTNLVFSGGRSRSKFEDDETFLGVDLAGALNRATDVEKVEFRHKLTTLTTLVVGTEALQDRFDYDRVKNANSIKVLPGFELKPSALISGTVFVGYRRFDPLDAIVPAYQGPIASVDARFVNGPRQFSFKVSRDLAYSFEATDPYYTLTDIGVGIMQRITYTWDIVARAGRQTLDYQPLQTARVSEPRTDTGHQYGGGFGYRIGQTVRLGLDVNYYRRHSPAVVHRDFEGFRFGASVSYGALQ